MRQQQQQDLTPITSADGLCRFLVDFADHATARAPSVPQADGAETPVPDMPDYRGRWHRSLMAPMEPQS
jgi:hypothetical protein